MAFRPSECVVESVAVDDGDFNCVDVVDDVDLGLVDGFGGIADIM